MPTSTTRRLAACAAIVLTGVAVDAVCQPSATASQSPEHLSSQPAAQLTAQNAPSNKSVSDKSVSNKSVNNSPVNNNPVSEKPASQALAAKAKAQAQAQAQADMPHHASGAHDFDFLVGDWLVENQRLKQRFVGSNDWETFSARQTNQPLPAGIGNYDDFVAKQWKPDFVGMSFRVFNPVTQLWSIYWLDNHTGGLNLQGQLNPPVVGKFDAGVGIFTGDDVIEGRPVKVRFTWSNITPNSAHWEQAMSTDNGASWEVNWQMQLTRVPR